MNTTLKIFETCCPIMYVNNVRNNDWITKGIKVFYLCKRVYTFSIETVVTQHIIYNIIQYIYIYYNIIKIYNIYLYNIVLYCIILHYIILYYIIL